MKTQLLIVVMVLLLSGSLASASVQYSLASVEIEDVVRVDSIADTRFMAANDNIIIDLRLYGMPLDIGGTGAGTLNISNQGYLISYSSAIIKTGSFTSLYNSTLLVYKNGVLVSNESSSLDIPWYKFGGQFMNMDLTITDGWVYGSNVSAEIGMLPAPEVTVTSSTSVKSIITITNVAELYRTDLKEDLNVLFSFMYWALTASPLYNDEDGGLLSFLYVFSFSMDALLWFIWLSIANTASVFAWIESAIVFYAGWRNNKIKGFVDNLIKWHILIVKVIAGAIYVLFIVVYDFIKSIVPGIG